MLARHNVFLQCSRAESQLQIAAPNTQRTSAKQFFSAASRRTPNVTGKFQMELNAPPPACPWQNQGLPDRDPTRQRAANDATTASTRTKDGEVTRFTPEYVSLEYVSKYTSFYFILNLKNFLTSALSILNSGFGSTFRFSMYAPVGRDQGCDSSFSVSFS